MLSNVGLRGVRLDLTQNKLYTLSKGTQQVLRDLKEPVNLYFYFSRDAAAKQSAAGDAVCGSSALNFWRR